MSSSKSVKIAAWCVHLFKGGSVGERGRQIESDREGEQEHARPQCVKLWEKWKETAGVWRGGCRRADKGAYEAAPHGTVTHIHTTQHDMTLITAEIDLTLLKTICGGEEEWGTEWNHTSKELLKENNVFFAEVIWKKKALEAFLSSWPTTPTLGKSQKQH